VPPVHKEYKVLQVLKDQQEEMETKALQVHLV
jgi:hypothetical protein